MSENKKNNSVLENTELEVGTFEIIKKRLNAQSEILKGKLDRLNTERKKVFGAIDFTLTDTRRITTENNCIARDITSIGDFLIFGYNVSLGLKSQIELNDVFSVYKYESGDFIHQPLALINDEKFIADFKELYKYYKKTKFSKFSIIDSNLFMVFRIGKNISDIKTFKWQIDGKNLLYIDNRSDHEFKFPPQHQFEWKRATRDHHKYGKHPHISIKDRVFVDTVGGDLTIKIENNTETGQGIYSEKVENIDQTLDDAEIYFAIVDNIIFLKIKPYQENEFRYIVYNEKIKKAIRIDSIKESCVFLPEGHGFIFSNGYYLQNGEFKQFDNELNNMLYSRRKDAANGEDFLYVFYNFEAGVYDLLPYNIIEQKMDIPIICNGFTFFDSGKLIFFKGNDTPEKYHSIQIWQTPYAKSSFMPEAQHDSFLYKIGNKDIVCAMSECNAIIKHINSDEIYVNLFIEIVKKCGDIIDAYFWLDKSECFDLKSILSEIKKSAATAIGEYEKVVNIRLNTDKQVNSAILKSVELLKTISNVQFENIDVFVEILSSLRNLRGEIISLKDLRYADLSKIADSEKYVSEKLSEISGLCIEFLLKSESLNPYREKNGILKAEIEKTKKVAEAKVIEEKLNKNSGDLDMLIEIISNLKIEDSTKNTIIIENISDVYANLNQIKISLKNKKNELSKTENAADFNSQLKLIGQSVINYLDISETPEKCEEYLSKILIQIEEYESKFSDTEEYSEKLAVKREEIRTAFESKKIQLIEFRNKKTNNLYSSAERILEGIKNRLNTLTEINAINGYYASDLMVEKVRSIINNLVDLGDTIKSEELQNKLKILREDALRQLKDKADLYEDGDNIIKMGSYRFFVNKQNLDLTAVLKEDGMYFHLAGTKFFEKIEDEKLNAAKSVWQQDFISENHEVYRGEYLAFSIYKNISSDKKLLGRLGRYNEEQLSEYVSKIMSVKYNEGYVKGVHNIDACLILKKLIESEKQLDLLRYTPEERALAILFWNLYDDIDNKQMMHSRLIELSNIKKIFEIKTVKIKYTEDLEKLIFEFNQKHKLFGTQETIKNAANYLFFEIVSGDGFIVSETAYKIYETFKNRLADKQYYYEFEKAIGKCENKIKLKIDLLTDWVEAFIENNCDSDALFYLYEIVSLLFFNRSNQDKIANAAVSAKIGNMCGSHSLIEKGFYDYNYYKFIKKLHGYEIKTAKVFEKYTSLKKELIDRFREKLKLKQFRSVILSSFVRNKLIDKVYLNLIGANLAKQMGVAGVKKRTDLMGLLLIISPPGYGKTTLMEYIANRLGIIFMKINGPALGNKVTSLDPSEAPNATAKEEVEKLNLAFEMGDNIMIYIDDIQHTNSEFLQKFISLCDGQRKIEGVYKGVTKTYDLRGRKVVVVMAGNPYTESGEKFQIPDMLANRADIYNLGDIIGDNIIEFKLSYIENSLTSNPVLNNLITKNYKDIYELIKFIETGDSSGVQFEGNHTSEEIEEYANTLKKMYFARDILLKVNKQYIYSATQTEDYRFEPSFKLQGSYRNMNKITEKILPALNDEELKTIILSHYENESQTLPSGAEFNLLKFKEITGWLDEAEKKRIDEIRITFQKNLKLRGHDDSASKIAVQMDSFNDNLSSIKNVLSEGVSKFFGKTNIIAESIIKSAIPSASANAGADFFNTDDTESWMTWHKYFLSHFDKNKDQILDASELAEAYDTIKDWANLARENTGIWYMHIKNNVKGPYTWTELNSEVTQNKFVFITNYKKRCWIPYIFVEIAYSVIST